MITHEQVEHWLQEEILNAKEAGVPISRDIDPKIDWPKATSFYAQCHERDKKRPNHAFYIRVSEYFLESDDEDAVRQTLMHEVIHTCKGCLNHGKEWRKWVSVVNREYNYQIARIGDYHTDFSLRKTANKYRRKASNPSVVYRVVCNECSYSTNRSRRSRLTENIENYICPYCGGSLRVERI